MQQDTNGQPGRRAIALLVAATFFMENLDGTIITTAVPAMSRAFGVATDQLSIGMSAYLLTLGVFIPASGWLAERAGARRVFVGAIALFTVASMLCGIVSRLDLFVAARVLQGIGGAMMVPVGRLIVLRTTPKEGLIAAIATLTWPALVAPILGPPVGGFIVAHASWRWIFYLNLPLGLLALAAASRLIPHTAPRPGKAFDWLGFLLAGGGIACAVIALDTLNQRDVAWPLKAAWAVAGAALLALAARHLSRADRPLLNLRCLGVPTFAVSIWGGSLFRVAIGAVPFVLPLMLQSAFGYDPFHAGLMMMAVFAGNLSIKPATTAILRTWGFRRVLIANGIANALALGACGLLTAQTPVPLVLLILFAGGVCRSIQFTAINTIAFADVPEDQMTDANTLFSTVMQVTLGLGIAIGASTLRIGQVFAGDTAAAFQWAFVLLGIIALAGILDSLGLDKQAGGHLIKDPSPRAPK
ncbi:MFS transporter [Sphingomonas immobilis]|nr:MFS transporter [Sphingomonas sp. CA1-15]